MSRFTTTIKPIALASVLIGLVLCRTALADHLSGGFGLETAAPITTDSPLPLARGGWSFGFRFEYTDFDAFSDRELLQLRGSDPEADLHSLDTLLRYSFRMAYGLIENLTLGVRVPIVSRLDVREPEKGHCHGGRCVAHDIIDHGDITGVGDALFFGLYRFFHAPASHTHLAALFGVKTPTGQTGQTGFEQERFGGISVPLPSDFEAGGAHHHDDSRVVEAEFQPGSGSWDGLLGLAYQTALEPFNFNSSFLYTIVSEGTQDTALGDIFEYNFALSYPLPQGRFVPCPSCAWNLILELNGQWQDKEERAGVENDNSGGHVLFLSPGVRFIGGRWNVAASGGYAVVSDLNGGHVEPDYRAVVSLNIAF
jgi:hypothetical protein